MYIFLIIILGFCLRLINIDKPEGLWNDEYVSWFVASTPFLKGFGQEVLKQCHMPLYYFYLKPFTQFSDVILRFTSVVPSLISIWIMYLVGKEYSKKNGYSLAILTAVLSFLVYYAQEVRFYSLLFLFSAISLLFTVKYIKLEYNNRKVLAGYITSLVLIILTHVLGFMYVGFNILYVAYKKKKIPLKAIIGISIIIVSFIPMGLNILKMLPSSQWWGSFSYTNILFLFSDFFSPILTNNINAPKIFYYSKNLLFIVLITIPTVIAFVGIILGFKKEKGLGFIAIAILFVMSVLAITGKIVFITKYSIETLPIFMLLVSLGLGSIGNKRVSALLLTSLISFHIFAIITPYYPAKIYRSEGHKLVGDVINKEIPEVILYTYYDELRFKKYITDQIISKELSISKTNRFQFLDSPELILKDVRSGEKLCIVFLDSVSFIPENWIETAKNKKIPEMFITFSEIRHKLIRELDINYKDYKLDKKGSWTVITAVKI